jgi:hypothetical protein
MVMKSAICSKKSESKLQDAYTRKDGLKTFLLGTLCNRSELRILRGQSDILRCIWTLACEEWWDLHIERHADPIPVLNHWVNPRYSHHLLGKQYPDEREHRGGCPVAILEENVPFPPLTPGPITELGTEYLYVNMMPIDLCNKFTVPDCCEGYLPLIKQCIRRMSPGRRKTIPHGLIAYLTIDERPCGARASQRRGGLHVESPGMLPVTHSIEDLKYSYAGSFVPASEHFWGRGIMMRDESFQGGIYMASTIADTCAVWNCRVNDTKGDIIGVHGNIERLRPLLGPPTMKLKANELVWMTDRTPHESLPLPPDMACSGARRQFFRLVVGEVTAWFADHSTHNPLGVSPPPHVRYVTGNKFEIHSFKFGTMKWCVGSRQMIERARNELSLRSLLHQHGLGHVAERLVHHGVSSVSALISESFDARSMWDDDDNGRRAAQYYEMPRLKKLISLLATEREQAYVRKWKDSFVRDGEDRECLGAVDRSSNHPISTPVLHVSSTSSDYSDADEKIV